MKLIHGCAIFSIMLIWKVIVLSGDSTFDGSVKRTLSQRCYLISRVFTDIQHVYEWSLALFNLFSALKLCLSMNTYYILTLLNYPILTVMRLVNKKFKEKRTAFVFSKRQTRSGGPASASPCAFPTSWLPAFTFPVAACWFRSSAPSDLDWHILLPSSDFWKYISNVWFYHSDYTSCFVLTYVTYPTLIFCFHL